MKLTIDYVLSRGVEEIIPGKKDLASFLTKKKITLYQGFDPTANSLHIGHFIGIRKLAQFQKLGHKVIFLIGDFTAMIGDPTDKKSARSKLTKQEVLTNLKHYEKQVSNVINFHGDNKAEVKFNSHWLSKLSMEEIVELASHFTLQQFIERDMFKVRIKEKKPIFLHEFLYPLMVGYDSVVLGVDLEMGGSDQLFNMLAGRTLTKALKNKDKFVLTMKLLTDQNGVKMGKTEGNAIFLSDTPPEIFGKIMSWPDSFLDSAIELLTDMDFGKSKNPMDLKKSLAHNVVGQLYGDNDAKKAQEHFEKTYQNKSPDFLTNMPLKKTLIKTITGFTLNKSASEARRLILQGAVDVNGEKSTDPNIQVKYGDRIKIGERIFGKVVK